MLFILLACSPEAEPDTPAAAETTWITDIQVAPSEQVPAALVVTFSTADVGRARVEFGLESPDERTTPLSTEGTEHAWPIIGLPPLSDVVMRVVAEIDGEEHVSGAFSAASGQLLPDSPTMTVTVDSYEAPPETTLLLSMFGKPCHTAMASLDGTVFWALPQGGDGFAGVSVLTEPGKLAYSTYPLTAEEDGVLARVDLAGAALESLPTPNGHHFFTSSAAGETWWLSFEEREVDGVPTRGDVVMRQTGPDTSEPVFSFWDHFAAPTGANAELVDWTHANWLTWSESRQTLTLSTAHTNHVIEMTGDGKLIRVLGGPGAEGSEYVFLNPLDAFRRPHGAHWTDDGDLLLFATIDDVSRVMRYHLNEETRVLETVWEFGTGYGYQTPVLGEAQELPDGNILISWGSTGVLQIVTPEGEVLWEAEAPFGSFFSQAHLLSSPYGVVEK